MELATCKNAKEYKIALKRIRKYIESENKKYPDDSFIKIDVPTHVYNLIAGYRSKNFIAQIYSEKNAVRISVVRTKLKDDGGFEEKITWEELMWIKDKLGYGNYDAVEILPKNSDVVNVANMRHIWIPDQNLFGFIWRNEK